MNHGAPWIELGDRRLPLDAGAFEQLGAVTPNQRAALQFLSTWFSAAERFTLHTSGSTGTPKPIDVTRAQMTASANKTAHALNLQPGMTALLCLDCRYVAGVMMVVRAVTTKMNLIVVEPSTRPFEKIAPESVDFAALVPYQMDSYLSEGPSRAHPFTAAATIILGGAPLTPSLRSDLATFNEAAVYVTYGMTETLSHVALQKLNAIGSPAQYAFHAVRGVTFSLDDRGCLQIHADHLPQTITTNDLVDLITPTTFRWLARWDNIINSGGVKVMPETVEQLVDRWLTAQTDRRRFFVTATPHPSLGSQVTLVVEGAWRANDEHALLEWLRLESTGMGLSKYVVPKLILYTDKFVETNTAKVDRKATLAIALPRPGHEH